MQPAEPQPNQVVDRLVVWSAGSRPFQRGGFCLVVGSIPQADRFTNLVTHNILAAHDYSEVRLFYIYMAFPASFSFEWIRPWSWGEVAVSAEKKGHLFTLMSLFSCLQILIPLLYKLPAWPSELEFSCKPELVSLVKDLGPCCVALKADICSLSSSKDGTCADFLIGCSYILKVINQEEEI